MQIHLLWGQASRLPRLKGEPASESLGGWNYCYHRKKGQSTTERPSRNL